MPTPHDDPTGHPLTALEDRPISTKPTKVSGFLGKCPPPEKRTIEGVKAWFLDEFDLRRGSKEYAVLMGETFEKRPDIKLALVDMDRQGLEASGKPISHGKCFTYLRVFREWHRKGGEKNADGVPIIPDWMVDKTLQEIAMPSSKRSQANKAKEPGEDLIATYGDVTYYYGYGIRAQVEYYVEGSIQQFLLSPPYWGLKDYGIETEMGHEDTAEQHVNDLADALFELAPYLTPTGTLWVNYGDVKVKKEWQMLHHKLVAEMLAGGWILAEEIIWTRGNDQPFFNSTGTLRHDHELIYVFARSPDYYIDAQAVKLPYKTTDNSGKGGRPVGTVWEIGTGGKVPPHPSPFPVALAERAYPPGERIFRAVDCRTTLICTSHRARVAILLA